MKDFSLVNLGKRIYSARTYQQMKQHDVCDKLGISQPFLSKIENGQVDISVVLLNDLANVLGTSVAWLIGETQSKSDLTDIERFELEQFKNYLKSKRNKK